MKNITVTVADEVYRQARIRAAELGTSVSAMVAGYLEQIGNAEDLFQQKLARQQAVFDEIDRTGRGVVAADRLSRDELYDRARARQEAELAKVH